MSNLPTISEQEILERVGARSFERGQSYFRHGAIFDARRQGMTLKAQCRGSSAAAYRVEATLDATGIDAADCTCPVGGEGYCKHVAALLLTWEARPEEFREVEDLDTALAARSKEELIALVKQMLRQEPELEVLLETPLPVAGKRTSSGPVSPETYRRQAAAVFARAGEDWGASVEIAAGLHALTTIGQGFAGQQDWAAAAAVYRGIVEEAMDQYESYQDEEGELGSAVQACVEGLGECLAGEKDDGETRAAIVRALFGVYAFDMKMGGLGLSDEVPDVLVRHTTPEERQMVAGWVREALPKGEEWSADYRRRVYGGFLLDLEADTLDDESFLRICRETGRLQDLVDRLLALGREEEAVAEAGRAGDYALIQLADLFVQHGHGDVAERLMVERTQTSVDTRVPAWLKQRYLARDDQAAALEMAEKLFRARPNLEEYRELRALAWPLARWEKLRPQLMALLDEPLHRDLRVRIYLDEGEIDEALEAVKPEPRQYTGYGYGYGWSHGYQASISVEVARAVEELRPRAAMEIYQREAERLIQQRGRGNYQEACILLERVRALYQRLGEPEAWDRYITQIRDQNRSLRALKEELASAKL
jgi:SWIM zinc finger